MCVQFPPTSQALTDPDGLLAIGGDLTPARLIAAYSRGIFPWYSPGQPILWWAPNPRAVIVPDQVHVSRSMARTLRNAPFAITCDSAFADVVAACAAPRAKQNGTWLTHEMRAAYAVLHDQGFAHSVECWRDNELCGGIYGVALGQVFFGESMFSRRTNASKVALIELCSRLHRWGYALLDCQVHNPHLESLGAQLLDRADFETILDDAVAARPHSQAWTA